MSKYTITPWRTQADILEVRQQLYNHDESKGDNRRHAIDRVMAWKLRGNLPHAVESTALLVDAILHHNITTITNISIFSIRAVYSAAFSRFVTGFCDIGRNKERNLEPSTMLDIAKQIGMPAEFVALRHEATHEELPGILRLVNATRSALVWLWDVYWSRLEEPESAETIHAALLTFKEEAATLLRDFRRSRRDALRLNSHSSPDLFGDILRACDNLVKMCKDSHKRVKALAEVVVAERLLLPASRELGSSLDGAFLIWDDFLKQISLRLHDVLRLLGIAMMESLSEPVVVDPQSDVEKEALATWVLRLLDLNSSESGEYERFVAGMMKWCCLHPGYWTQRIGRQILQTGSRELRTDWEELLSASSMQVDGDAGRAAEELDRIAKDGERAQFDIREGDDSKGWTRAIVSPSRPVGVV